MLKPYSILTLQSALQYFIHYKLMFKLITRIRSPDFQHVANGTLSLDVLYLLMEKLISKTFNRVNDTYDKTKKLLN